MSQREGFRRLSLAGSGIASLAVLLRILLVSGDPRHDIGIASLLSIVSGVLLWMLVRVIEWVLEGFRRR